MSAIALSYAPAVSAGVKQSLVIAAGGVVLAVVIVLLARRRLMTMRYTVGWLGMAALTILTAALAGLVTPIAEAFDMTGTAVFLAAATAILIAICIQLSITVSGLRAQLRELAEDHALLAAELDERVPSTRR
jgi:hypothetical protein